MHFKTSLVSALLLTTLALHGGASAQGVPSRSASSLGMSPRTSSLASGNTQRSAAALPFGGLDTQRQMGVRPESLKGPSGTVCSSNRLASGKARRDPSGRVQTINDPRAMGRQSGNIYGNCNESSTGTQRSLPGLGGDSGLPAKGKVKSAFNTRTNVLNAASDGYVNRSATSSMMPKRQTSMYDPATGALRPPKALDPYQVYQR